MGLSKQQRMDMGLIGASLLLILVLYNFIEDISLIAAILFIILIVFMLCSK